MPREIVVQGEVGGVTIAFTDPVDGKADYDAILDERLRSIGRQRAKGELSEKLLALQICERSLKEAPERMVARRKELAEEKAHKLAEFDAKVEMEGRRNPSLRQRTVRRDLEQQIDRDIATKLERLENESRQFERDKPLIEAQISRLRAIIAGRDPTEYLGEEGAAAAA